MIPTSKGSALASIGLQPKGQSSKKVQEIVASVLKLAGCTDCGRLARLDLKFLGDPPPDFAQDGVVHFEFQGPIQG